MPPAVNDRAKIGIAAERGVAVMLFALVVSPVFYFSLFFFCLSFSCVQRTCAHCLRTPPSTARGARVLAAGRSSVVAFSMAISAARSAAVWGSSSRADGWTVPVVVIGSDRGCLCVQWLPVESARRAMCGRSGRRRTWVVGYL